MRDRGEASRISVIPRVLVFALLGISLAACAVKSGSKLDAALEKKPAGMSSDMKSDFESAVKLLQQNRYADGVELLNGVVSKSQNHAAPYINLAIAHGKLGNKEAAEENIKKALLIDPGNPVAGNEYALLLRKSGRFVEAKAAYEAMLKKYPSYPMAHKNLAILCDLYMRDYECALKSYEAYLAVSPEDSSAKIWIADVQQRLGR